MSEPATASNGHGLNPFARRDDFSSRSLMLHKVASSITYLLLLITSIYYGVQGPHQGDADKHHGRFWWHNIQTPFAQNSILTSIYWILLWMTQLYHPIALHRQGQEHAHAAANVGSHFVANNLLLFGFVNLWVRGHYWLSELLIVINFFNLSVAYFRNSTTPRLIHIGTVSGPLAWNFVAMYWVGAVAVHSNALAARILANVFIWGWLGYGLFFLGVYKDYTMGFALSVLSFSTGVGQFLTSPVVLQLQWIFAFAIGGLLFVISLAVGVPGLLGRDPFPRGQIVSEDRERAPLLADE